MRNDVISRISMGMLLNGDPMNDVMKYVIDSCLYELVGGLEHVFHILGMSSSQLTFTPSFFRGVGQPPTRSL